MELNIKGDTGTHNTYQETKIDKVETFYSNPTIHIHLNFSLHIGGEKVIEVMKELQQRFGLKIAKLINSHFDGEGKADGTTYQFAASPSIAAEVLQCISQKLGAESTASIRYISGQKHFDRNHLSLGQAIKIAESESRL